MEDVYGVKNNYELSPDQTNEIQQVFQLFDKDKDGFIFANEVQIVMRALRQHPSDREVEAYLRSAKADQSGFVNLSQFTEMMRKSISQMETPESVLNAFLAFDKLETGLISVSELKHALTNFGPEVLSQSEADAFEREAQSYVNRDGKIDYREMMKLLLAS